jgi:hypothetical protein
MAKSRNGIAPDTFSIAASPSAADPLFACTMASAGEQNCEEKMVQSGRD